MENCSTTKTEDRTWRGSSLSEILHNPWSCYTKPMMHSENHTVLFDLPVTLQNPPNPSYSSCLPQQDNNHVLMPFSQENLYPVKENDQVMPKPKWDMIKNVLSQPITSFTQFEEILTSYNPQYKELKTLCYYFNEELSVDEAQHFFSSLLPQIIRLALQLPEVIPSPIPLLKQGKTHSLSLSQLQVASLLSNFFLSTFPLKKNLCPVVNFIDLYNQVPCKTNIEKIKCLVHYFKRVCSKMPVGVVTFERRYLSEQELPKWDSLETSIASTKLHISSTGSIESDGLGMLQVDFADPVIGGILFDKEGNLQEQIRFVICPELIVSRLFTEVIGPTEAVIITGVERFSSYEGYGSTFKWTGTYEDTTPYDLYGRRRTTVVAIDALSFHDTTQQFLPVYMIRELNKAYVGFYEDPSVAKDMLFAVATGNWGCGAFNGSVHLKVLLQIMACTATNRNLAYFRANPAETRDAIYHMYQFLSEQNVTVAQLWRYLCRFNQAMLSEQNNLTASRDLYPYIQQIHLNREN